MSDFYSSGETGGIPTYSGILGRKEADQAVARISAILIGLQHYENSFLRLATIAKAAKSGALNPMAVLSKDEKLRLRDLPLSILDRSLVKYFKEGVMESAD